MSTTPPRRMLDALASHYRLQPAQRVQLLEHVAARPSEPEWRRALVVFGRVAGALSLGFGVVFFIAANWSALSPLGRIGLLQGLFVLTILVALMRPPPRVAGQAALLLAVVGVGAMFALFGQTYQTGADVYELFFLWAALALPFAIAARWSPVTALWLVVLNLGIARFCGWLPGQHPLWMALGMFGDSWSLRLVLAMWANLAVWALLQWAAGRYRQMADIAPEWLRQALLVVALVYGTVGMCIGIVAPGDGLGLSLPLFLLACAAIATYAIRRHNDVLPIAALAASAVAIGVALIIEWVRWSGDGAALFFALTTWLVLSSSVCAWGLMQLNRRWSPADAY